MNSPAYRVHLLEQEYDAHHGPHRCYYIDADADKCPSEYPSLPDFLESRGMPGFPVEFENDLDFGQVSGQDEIPVGIPKVVKCCDTPRYETLSHKEPDDMTICESCGARWWTADLSESPTNASSGPFSNEAGDSSTVISLTVQGQILKSLFNIEKSLATLIEQGNREPVVVTIDAGNMHDVTESRAARALNLLGKFR